MIVNTPKRIACLMVVALLSGCALMGPKVHQRAFLFEQPHIKAMPKPRVNTLVVQSVDVKPAFSGQQFVYRLSNFQYTKDYNQIFFVPLEQQLTSVLLVSMQQSGVAKQVQRFGSFIQNGMFMKTYVSAFYVDQQGDGAWAVIHWHMKLYAKQQMKYHLLHAYDYVQRVPLKGRTPIQAWSQGLQAIVQSIIHDVAAAKPLSLTHHRKH